MPDLTSEGQACEKYNPYELHVPCMVMNERVGVAIIVQRFDKKILSCLRTGCRDQNGLWQLPGGGIKESGESAYDAAMRELYEETGHSNRFLDLIGTGIGLTDEGNPHVTTFFSTKAIPSYGPPQNKEPEKHGPWEWLTVEELLSRPTFPLIRTVLGIWKG